ncbi:MAG: methyltransferase domain-containing protein [Candidatus Pacebacteria bacterium]|nr:methyltransferase domain-containing protein [Candidatus Paceibacterota bacterium]
MKQSSRSTPLRLNLGCGLHHKTGYINADIDPSLKPDKVVDLRKKLPFATNSTQTILLQDILEHLTKEDGFALLKECARILRFGGTLTVRVPNVTAISKKFRWQPDLLMLYIYGDTSKNGEWGAHKYGYSPRLWRELLRSLGLEPVSQRTIDTNYLFVTRKSKKIQANNSVHCSTLMQFLLTPWYYQQGKPVVWELTKTYPILFGKILLRPLSRLAVSIVVNTDTLYRYAAIVLKSSHLRIRSEVTL